MSIRPYRDADAAAVIGIFRRFMAELTPPRLRAEFDAYVETAIREELGRIREYYLGRPGDRLDAVTQDAGSRPCPAPL